MKITLLLLSSLALTTLGHGQALRITADKNAAAEQKAFRTNDLGWFDSAYDKDFVSIGKDGKKASRAEALSALKLRLPYLSTLSPSVKASKVEARGQDVLVTVDLRMVADQKATAGKEGHKAEVRAEYVESWSRKNGQWKIVSQRVLSEMTIVDGKPIAN